MTELTFELLRQELAPLHSRFDAIEGRLDAIEPQIKNIRIRTDGLPMLGEAIETLRRDTRSLRAAFNDFARTTGTASGPRR